MKKWEQVYDEEKHDVRWTELREQILNEVATYVETTRMPHKRMYATPWPRYVRHLGHLTTSRVEGCHASLKGWIGTSIMDIFGVLKCIEKHVERQVTAIDSTFQKELHLDTIFLFDKPFFDRVRRRVSCYALRIVYQQLVEANKTKENNEPCKFLIMKNTLGLPCKHVIRSLLEAKELLTTEIFHAHWLLEHDDGKPHTDPYPILPPPMQRTKGSTKDAENKANWCHQKFHPKRSVGI
ncbi:hypothetical protein PsorP6_015707 [Peronosclerospora sorghi]|uniref:Uncharacterized protein n=1 Tax=Peronosclerospora sorghi TaxID=230839 RepID=A0ACC0WP78_9STRA|nr:hypothetical protein PsorP6_015707 [Peronosclerospora sorghi]